MFLQNSNYTSSAVKLVILTTRCPQNHPCPSVKVCPVGALSQKGFAAPTVDYSKCIRCGKCVKFCPKQALVFEPIPTGF